MEVIREMLLLELQMKEMRVSQASWFKMRMPVKEEQRRAKLGSVMDHWV